MTTPTLSLHMALLNEINRIYWITRGHIANGSPLHAHEALSAVVELHKPVRPDGVNYVCTGCNREALTLEPNWPCDTVLIIGRRLGVMPE